MIAGALSLAMMAIYSGGPQTSMILLIIGVLAIGLPHGALDYIELRDMASGNTARLALYAGAYLLLALMITAGWILAPAPVFAILLTIAWLHFGTSDSETTEDPAFRIPESFIRGGMIIFGPLVYWRGSLATYFGYMSRQPEGAVLKWLETWLVPFMPGFWAASICCVLLFALHARMRATALEMAIIAGIVIILPPLAAFATYFTLWHSWGHLRREAPAFLSRDITPRRLVISTAIVTLITVCLFAPLLLLGPPGWLASLVPVIFIMLLALTPPHMVLHMLNDSQS
jgi:Brp/Blh family beta-carotene 15,15'-monooxygenase